MRSTLLLALTFYASPTLAGTVLDYEETFATNYANLSGNDGWVAGYSGDAWTTQGFAGAGPQTNANVPNGWNLNSYTDNHITQSSSDYGDFQLDVDVLSIDDDTVGVVFRFQDPGNFYLAMFSQNAFPSHPVGGQALDFEGAALYEIQGGLASELQATAGAGFTYFLGAWSTIRVIADGNLLEVYLDRNFDAIFAANELMLSVVDSSFSSGRVGLYSFSNECQFDDLRVYLFDDDNDGVANEEDNCPLIANDLQEDLDGDTLGDVCDSDIDGDGSVGAADCDDYDAAVRPGAVEVCNGIDDDCDLAVDIGAVDAPTWYQDLDADTYGSGVTQVTCAQPAAFVAVGGDCDDASGITYPGAPEICDGLDNDCDLASDEDAIDATTWYADVDADTFGNPAVTARSCTVPANHVADATDCDDALADVNPAADERCNGRDDDCDTQVDEADAIDPTTWHPDADLDGYGDPSVSTDSCDAPAGHIADDTDCDDSDALEHPGADEVCDGDDDDCDGSVDEGDAVDQVTSYADDDGDGFGDPGAALLACDVPADHVLDSTDCDDTRADATPGAPELCNGMDDDCDTVVDNDAIDTTPWYADTDGDGFGTGGAVLACDPPLDPTGNPFAPADGDCDDEVASTYPGAVEQCNELDDDCDTEIDEEVVDVPWYVDADGDGYGDPDTAVVDCLQPPGTVLDGTDCDDADAAINPGATEIDGNDVDEDCDEVEGEVPEPGSRPYEGPSAAEGIPLGAGCGCATPGSAPSGWLLLLGLIALRRR